MTMSRIRAGTTRAAMAELLQVLVRSLALLAAGASVVTVADGAAGSGVAAFAGGAVSVVVAVPAGLVVLVVAVVLLFAVVRVAAGVGPGSGGLAAQRASARAAVARSLMRRTITLASASVLELRAEPAPGETGGAP